MKVDNFYYVELEDKYIKIHHIFLEMRRKLNINEGNEAILLSSLKADIVNDLHNNLRESLINELYLNSLIND